MMISRQTIIYNDAGPGLLLWNSYIYFNIFDRDVCGQNVHKSVKTTNLYIMRL